MVKGDLFYNQQRIKLSQSPYNRCKSKPNSCYALSCYTDALLMRDLWFRIETIVRHHYRLLALAINIWITRLYGWLSPRRAYSVFYTPICYLFFAGSTHTREQMTANATGIKKSCFSQSTVVWSSPASFASRRRERDHASLPFSRLRARACADWPDSHQSDTFHLETVRMQLSSRHNRAARRRYDLSGVSTGAHTSLINIPTAGTTYNWYSRYNRRQYAPIYP